MIERKISATPVDTFTQADRSGVLQANSRQQQTQRFFQSMGAFAKEQQQIEQKDEVEEYNHVLKLQQTSFNAKAATAQQMLSKDAYRDYSIEQLKETPEYQAAIGTASSVVDKKAKESMLNSLNATLGAVEQVHTNAKQQETMDSLVWDALNAQPDGESYFAALGEGAQTVGWGRAYDVAADEALAAKNLDRATILLDKDDPLMLEETKTRLLNFQTQALAAKAKEGSKYKADIGRLKVHMKDSKDPDIGYKILELMEANGDADKEAYGAMQGQIDLLERRKGQMALAEQDVILGATDGDIEAKYGLDTTDVKKTREQMYERAVGLLKQGDTTDFVRLVKAAPHNVAPSLKATVESTMMQLSAVNPEEISNITEDDPRFEGLKTMMQVGDITNDTLLREALGGAKYEDYLSLRLDAQRGGMKYALLQMKERQQGDMAGTAASRHPRWTRERADILKNAMDDYSDEQKDLMQPFLQRKLDNLAKRHSMEKAEEMLKHWVGMSKSFDYDGDTVVFADAVVNDAESLNIIGHEVDPEELFEKYHEYTTKALQVKYPALEGVSLLPNPTRPDWYTIIPDDASVVIDKPLIHTKELYDTFLKENPKDKFEKARDAVREDR